MSICVEIDLNGFLVESTGQTPPACTDYILTTAEHFDRLTYWADLAIELDPSGAIFPVLVAAMFTSVGIVLGARMVWDNMRIFTKEA